MLELTWRVMAISDTIKIIMVCAPTSGGSAFFAARRLPAPDEQPRSGDGRLCPIHRVHVDGAIEFFERDLAERLEWDAFAEAKLSDDV